MIRYMHGKQHSCGDYSAPYSLPAKQKSVYAKNLINFNRIAPGRNI